MRCNGHAVVGRLLGLHHRVVVLLCLLLVLLLLLHEVRALARGELVLVGRCVWQRWVAVVRRRRLLLLLLRLRLRLLRNRGGGGASLLRCLQCGGSPVAVYFDR